MRSSHNDRVVPVLRALPAPGRYLCGLTWDGEYLWHSDQDAGKIFALEPTDASVVRVLDCPAVRADLACQGRALCQVGGRPKRIVLVDSQSGDVLGEKPVRPSSGRLCGIEMGPEGMWMCLRAPGVVQVRDFATMSVQRELPVPGSPSGLTYVGGLVVYAEFETGLLRVVDTSSGTLLATAPVEGHPTGITWDGRYLWYCDFEARRLKCIALHAVLQGSPTHGEGTKRAG